MSKKIIISSLVVVLALFSFFAFSVEAKDGIKCDKKDGNYFSVQKVFLEKIEMVLENVDGKLSVEKVQKIKALKLMIKKEMILKEAEKKIVYMDLEAEFEKEHLYINAINSFIDQKYDLKKQISKTYVDAIIELDQILKAK